MIPARLTVDIWRDLKRLLWSAQPGTCPAFRRFQVARSRRDDVDRDDLALTRPYVDSWALSPGRDVGGGVVKGQP